jgi:drug/metabolite transporter (DMT)-like permease
VSIVAQENVEAAEGNVGVAPAHAVALSANTGLAVLAIGCVWLLWGSTFAAIRLATGTIPVFAMVAARFLVAGAVLWGVCLILRRGNPTWADWRRALVTGATLLVLGNAVTAWSTQFVPTGLCSLLLSLTPIWMALMDFAITRERPTRAAMIGMLLGLAGMALLLQPRVSGGLPLVPTLALIFGSISWAFGSIYQRRGGTTNVMLATALQMLVGGALIGIESALLGEWGRFGSVAISSTSLAAWAWLVVGGSLFAYSAYLWTMQHVPTSLASTYAYVNPIVALILGALLFGERLSPLGVVASAVILCGVALMMLPSRALARSLRGR